MTRLAMVGMLLLGAAIAGCGSSPCDKLQDICNACKDQNTKDACNQAVKTYRAAAGASDTYCQAAIDSGAYSSCK